MSAKTKTKITPARQLDLCMEAFYKAHDDTFNVVDYLGNGINAKEITRRMNPAELKHWPPRAWWLSVETLCDSLVAIGDELPPWKIEPASWLLFDVMKHPLDRFYAGEVGRRIDFLKDAQDNTKRVRHEGVLEIYSTFKGAPGSEEMVQRFRGCSQEQAVKILSLFDANHQKNPNIDVDELEEELNRTCVWPQDENRVKKEATDRRRLVELAERWAKRPRFVQYESKDAGQTLDAIMQS